MVTDAELEDVLRDAARAVFRNDRENLTVNNVRTHAESSLGLDEGFFKTGDWKGRSKAVVQAIADVLLATEDSTSEPEEREPSPRKAKPATKPQPKKEAKKPAPKKATPAPTKRKASSTKKRRAVGSSDEEDEDDEDDFDEDEDGSEDFSDLPSDDDNSVDDEEDDFEDESERRRKKARTSEKPKSKPKSTKPAKNKAVAALAESGASSPLSELVSEDVDKRVSDSKTEGGDAASDSEMSVVIDEPPKRKPAKSAKTAKTAKTAKRGEAKQAAPKKAAKRKADDSDSSLSVLDDPPPKRGKKSGASAASATSPDDAEVKKLQAQLVKCGLRKIWAIELKAYGNDAKAKIRHLKGMLHDIGMDGRFSESRAREIKERRELEADLEAVQEMDRSWGTHGSSGRPSRSRQYKSLKEESSEEEEQEEEEQEEGDGEGKEDNSAGDDDDDDEEDAAPKTARRSRFGDLAFLGSDSESD